LTKKDKISHFDGTIMHLMIFVR